MAEPAGDARGSRAPGQERPLVVVAGESGKRGRGPAGAGGAERVLLMTPEEGETGGCLFNVLFRARTKGTFQQKSAHISPAGLRAVARGRAPGVPQGLRFLLGGVVVVVVPAFLAAARPAVATMLGLVLPLPHF